MPLVFFSLYKGCLSFQPCVFWCCGTVSGGEGGRSEVIQAAQRGSMTLQVASSTSQHQRAELSICVLAILMRWRWFHPLCWGNWAVEKLVGGKKKKKKTWKWVASASVNLKLGLYLSIKMKIGFKVSHWSCIFPGFMYFPRGRVRGQNIPLSWGCYTTCCSCSFNPIQSLFWMNIRQVF